jgi:chemotaxis family two-component system response regulator Rcp1
MNRLQVLLAEDNAGDVFLIREALRAQSLDYDLHVLKDGTEAARYLDKIGSSPGVPCPDVFLVDLNLPSGDGHKLIETFRRHPQCALVPVVVVTSSDSPRDRERAQALGANAYFRKPSDLTAFLQLGRIVAKLVGRD